MEGIKSRNRALFNSLSLHHVVVVNFSSVLRQNCHSGNVTQSTNIKFTHGASKKGFVPLPTHAFTCKIPPS